MPPRKSHISLAIEPLKIKYADISNDKLFAICNTREENISHRIAYKYCEQFKFADIVIISEIWRPEKPSG